MLRHGVLLHKYFKSLINTYIYSFKTQLSKTRIKCIDTKNLKVTFFSKGYQNYTMLLKDAVLDSSLIFSLTPNAAATLGFYFGLH